MVGREDRQGEERRGERGERGGGEGERWREG